MGEKRLMFYVKLVIKKSFKWPRRYYSWKPFPFFKLGRRALNGLIMAPNGPVN
jgi:hypothetical protein